MNAIDTKEQDHTNFLMNFKKKSPRIPKIQVKPQEGHYPHLTRELVNSVFNYTEKQILESGAKFMVKRLITDKIREHLQDKL